MDGMPLTPTPLPISWGEGLLAASVAPSPRDSRERVGVRGTCLI
jgi:hypothetical protein